MLAACEVGEVFALLEGGAGGAAEAAEALASLYQAVREPWLTRALLQYHARTGSSRALDLLARAPEPHARHLLDALLDQLRADRPARLHALAALAPLVARRPAWLHRLPPHPLARDLLRAARREREPLPLLHALLACAALLCAAPALAAPHWPDLADALLRPAALEPPPPPATRAHLQLAQLALFQALYATHPCTLVEALRAELGAAAARDAWERGLAPLLRCVRLHPALVAGSRQREAEAARWARLEAHDVVAQSRRLELRTPERGEPEPAAPLAAPPPPASPPPGSGAHAARALGSQRPGGEQWFALADRCGADSAPHTPLPADVDAVEPPEAAVEATPENTPAKETRAQFRFPTDSGAVRAIGRRSRPASPPRKETSPPAAAEPYGGRLSRVMAERRAVDSPVPFGGAPPGGAVARPEPRGVSVGVATEGEPSAPEDREVLELTRAAARSVRPEDAWVEDGAGGVEAALRALTDPRARSSPSPARPAPRPRARARPPRRPASCPPARGGGAVTRTNSVAVQTVDTWPEPYEFIIADYYRNMPDDPRKDAELSQEAALPCERLDAYLADLYAGGSGPARGAGGASGAELAEQLALVHAQLMYERWRREAHAERNRRLLGRCRQTRALELQVAALKERARALARERDELRARRERAEPAPEPSAPPAPDREALLEAELERERAARARADAALHEAEAQRALDQAELQRTRGESFEATRHVEALARAALAAERRAEHVRRLRRELLVLAEREARLSAAARAGAAGRAREERDAGDERALRAAAGRAEAECAAMSLRAEAAAARAHDLEAQVAARDAVVAELKRATRHAAEEHAAQLDALRDKYAALMRVLRAAEARHLELLAGVGAGGAGGAGAVRPGPAGGAGKVRPGPATDS